MHATNRRPVVRSWRTLHKAESTAKHQGQFAAHAAKSGDVAEARVAAINAAHAAFGILAYRDRHAAERLDTAIEYTKLEMANVNTALDNVKQTAVSTARLNNRVRLVLAVLQSIVWACDDKGPQECPTCHEFDCAETPRNERFSLHALHTAFNAVKNTEHYWKNPINARMPEGFSQDLVRDAIIFFTATVPTFYFRGNAKLVKADGYRLGPAGDH